MTVRQSAVLGFAALRSARPVIRQQVGTARAKLAKSTLARTGQKTAKTFQKTVDGTHRRASDYIGSCRRTRALVRTDRAYNAGRAKIVL